ncbi:hypothetical protein M758_3G261800 [Ceratodon purpureus]|nr:hypothetical protein M758_3G261800 [Ceratodon purpureus]
MVEEVLHTQRDFKDILLRLVNAQTNLAPAQHTEVRVEDTPTPVTAVEDSLPVTDMTVPCYDVQAPLRQASPQPSWVSADTVLLTPNTRNSFRPLRDGTREMVAVSADVSDQSIANGSVNDSIGHPANAAPDRDFTSPVIDAGVATYSTLHDRGPRPVLQDPHSSTGACQTNLTRGKTSNEVMETHPVDASSALFLKFPPKAGSDAVAVNKACYITHPDMGDEAVAEGRTGGSWKAKAQKLGNLCQQGEQMVQIHKVLVQKVRLLHVEERQPFQFLDDAVVKCVGSNVFVKWDCKFIHKKTF